MTSSPVTPRLRITPYLIIGVCLYFITQYFLQHKAEFSLILHLSVKPLLVITLLLLINNYLISMKLFSLLKLQGLTKVSSLEWFKIFSVSRFINFHVPQGANLYRMIKLKKDYLFPWTQSIGFMLVSSWLEVILTLLFVFILLFVLKSPSIPTISYYSIQEVIFLLAISLMFSPFLCKILFSKIKVSWPFLKRIQDKSLELLEGFTRLKQSPAFLGYFLVITLITFCLYAIAIGISFQAIQTPLSISHSIIFTTVLLLSRSFNVVPGNLGISELICGYTSDFLSVSTGSGILVSGIIRILEYGFLLMLTLVFYRRPAT
jgi:hypothetical protein